MVTDTLSPATSYFLWDIRALPPGDDYVLKIVISDHGYDYLPAFVRDLRISSLEYFLLDTTPPVGKIVVAGDADFVKDRDVILLLSAFDETTGVRSVVIEEEGGDSKSVEISPTAVQSWSLKGGDGDRCLLAHFTDYGGNVVTNTTGSFFRRYVGNHNNVVTSMLAGSLGGSRVLFTAFGGDQPALFKNRQLLTTLTDEVTAMAFFDDSLYFAVRGDDNTGSIKKLDGDLPADVYNFQSAGSSITAMASYAGSLYAGTEGGDMYAFDGQTVSHVQSFASQVCHLFSDNNLLFVFLDGQSPAVVYDGENFNSASESNAHIQI
jgi:hypothetical protein